MRTDLRWKIGIVSILLFASTGLGERWLARVRPVPPEERIGRTITVVNGKDDGAGSLRHALYAVASSQERVRIELRTRAIRLERPLPPVVGAPGVVIESTAGRCLIDGSGFLDPVFDLMTSNSIIQNVELRGSGSAAVMVRASNVILRDLSVSENNEGVRIAGGASDVEIVDSRFSSNGIGIAIAPEASRVVVRNNVFQKNTRAAVWNVSARPLALSSRTKVRITGNRFEEDRMAIVIANGAPLIESNEMIDAREAAVYVLGGEVEARRNLIRGGLMGIFLDGTRGARIEGNEMQGSRAIAVIVRGGEDTLIRGNRIHRSAYGLASIFSVDGEPQRFIDNVVLTSSLDGIYVLGGSPQLELNRALGGAGAGIRAVDFVPVEGPTLSANPQLRGNVLEGNTLGELVRATFRAEPPDGREAPD